VKLIVNWLLEHLMSVFSLLMVFNFACVVADKNRSDDTGDEAAEEAVLEGDLGMAHLTTWVTSGPADGLYFVVALTPTPVDCGDDWTPAWLDLEMEPRFEGLIEYPNEPGTQSLLLDFPLDEILEQSGLYHEGDFHPIAEAEILLEYVEAPTDWEIPVGDISGSWTLKLDSGSLLQGESTGTHCGGSVTTG
jgi:hypothetical protein